MPVALQCLLTYDLLSKYICNTLNQSFLFQLSLSEPEVAGSLTGHMERPTSLDLS